MALWSVVIAGTVEAEDLTDAENAVAALTAPDALDSSGVTLATAISVPDDGAAAQELAGRTWG
jgi:hypothetical protein